MKRSLLLVLIALLFGVIACGSAATPAVVVSTPALSAEPAGEETEDLPPAPTAEPTDAPLGTTRSNPAPVGQPVTMVGYGSFTLDEVQWTPGAPGLAVVKLTLICEVSTEESCNTIDYLYNVIGGSGTVYDQEFLDVPDPHFYMNEVFGGGTISGYAGFTITQAEDELVLRVNEMIGDSEAYFTLNTD